MSKHRTHRTWWDRLLSGVLCLALALGLLPTAGLVQTADAAHWADPYGKQLVEWGVMNSSSDLRLGDTTTRAEFVAMMNRAFGYRKLGDMPFADVPYTAWYAEDINIAYNAGYFKGISGNKASPTSTLTREEAAVMLSRCMRLQETVGEGLSFTDDRDLHDWSRGLVNAAADEGVINGLPDGSFSPANNITRGEVAAMLVRALGTPISKAGSYDELGGGVVYGNVTISSSDVTLRDTVIDGNLYITGGVDLGNVLLENVTVFGRIIISGGGESYEGQSSVVLRNVEADELAVDSMVNQFVTVSAYGLTDIPITNVRSDTYLEDSSADGHGLHHIELVGKSGTLLQLASNSSSGIKEVVNKTPLSLLQLVRGTAEKITIDEYATGSELLVDIDTVVKELNLDVATRVYGKGDIIDLVIGADGCEVEILPEHVEIRPGLTATLVDEDGNERTIGSTDAAELSSDPRILSGYPSVSSKLTPTSAEGLYAGNKPGIIYWAVSAIADGSVDVKDLIDNPAYGGNILKDGEAYQSGGIDARARTEYGRPITGLEPDGSYYISAVLVDERGSHSPLKVYSFTTPDNTVPAFTDGYPRMTKVSCEVAQVTAMANKSCMLYWVLLKAGATAPTAQNFKSGSFGGNYGSGSISVVKNVPVSIQVNTSRLQEKTDYDLYLWLTDANGSLSSEVIKVLNEETKKPADPSFSTPDETPPSVSNVRQTNANLDDAIEFAFTINEAPATLYWAVVTATDTNFIRTTDDPNSLRIQTKVQNGTGAIVSGSKEYKTAKEETIVGAADFQNKLKYSEYGTHNFRLYYVAKDAAGNYSEVRSILIYTRDNEKPTVSISFSAAKYSTPEDQAAGRNPKPLADTNITLTFSEQVKGYGNDAKTFVELYSEVDRYVKQGLTETAKDIADGDKTNNPLTKAKNKLGEELAKSIELYYEPDSKSDPIKMGPKGTVDGDEEFGWLNLREATVKLNAGDGTVELTLINGKAVKLGGGMSYHFQFHDIYDDSYTSNPLVVMRDGKENKDGIMDSFTTVFAQVWLRFKGNTVADGVRMDIIVDMIPEAMSSTAEEAYWDMIMWCDTSVYFDIYRQDGDKWTKLNTESIRYSPNSMNGVSLIGQAKLTLTDQQIGKSLASDTTYGIHFTQVNNAAEEDTATARPSWSEKVTMWFSVIAGSSTDIDGVSGNVRGNFNEDRSLKDSAVTVTEIGTDYDRETESKLEAYRQFTNTLPPEFYDTSPKITPKSNSVDMSVTMDNSGRLYYVAAPVIDGTPSIPTTTGGGKAINGSNDTASPRSDDPKHEAATDMTYIPTGGADRNEKEWDIYYKSGDKLTGSAPGIDWITDPADYLASAEGVVWGGPIEVGRALQTIEITGLEPNTKYYIYIVLQGNGDATSTTPEIYQVTTDRAYPPVIAISPGGSTETGITADITTLDGAPIGNSTTKRQPIDSELNWALVNWANLPDFFKYEFTWSPTEGTSRTETLINMLVDRTGSANNSPSLFDNYKDNATLVAASGSYARGTKASEFTDKIMDFIKNEGTFNAEKERPIDHGVADYSGDPVSPKFRNVPTDNTDVEYGILVFARVAGAGDETKNYSFAAAQGMYMPDPKPPEFQPETVPSSGVSYISITGLKAYTTYTPATGGTGSGTLTQEKSGWRSLSNETIASLYFSGEITIHFDRPVYLYVDGAQKAVVAAATSADDKVYFRDVLSLTGITANQLTITGSGSDSGTKAQQDFTIKFTGLQRNATIVFPSSTGSITNGSPTSESSSKRLTLQFDPFILGKVFDPEGIFVDIYEGGFRATWK